MLNTFLITLNYGFQDSQVLPWNFEVGNNQVICFQKMVIILYYHFPNAKYCVSTEYISFYIKWGQFLII